MQKSKSRCTFLLLLATSLLCLTNNSTAATIQINPGNAGDAFAIKSFDLQQLVGIPATDNIFEVDFLFTDNKFVNSSIFFVGSLHLRLVVEYDRPFASGQTFNSLPNDLFTRGFGHVTDENGDRLNYPGSFGSFDPTLNTVTLRVGPDRPAGSAPAPGATTSDAYYGAFFRYDFFLPIGSDVPLIQTATLFFDDARTGWPQPAPLPHIVGQSVIPVPAAFWLFGSGLLSLMGLAMRKKKP